MTFKTLTNPEDTTLWKYGAMYIKEAQGFYLHIQPVIFGYRVALIKDKSMIYEVNLCAGDSLEHIALLYTLTEKILSQAANEEELYEIIRQIPVMEIRPYYKDPSWIVKFCELSDENLYVLINDDMIQLDPEVLNKGRERSFTPQE